jgi:hypothetical protein
MDIETLLAVIRRHWLAVVAVLAVTVVASFQVRDHVSSEYEVRGNMILLPPPTVPSNIGGDVDVNPWARFGAEAGAAAALVEVLQSDVNTAEVLDDPAVTMYAVGINPRNGAIIDITVRASRVESAGDAYQRALDVLTTELDTRQEASGAPKSTWMKADVLTRPQSAKELPGSKMRAMLGVGLLGVLASVSLAVALDTVIGARRRSAHRRSAAIVDHHDGDEPVDEESIGDDELQRLPAYHSQSRVVTRLPLRRQERSS